MACRLPEQLAATLTPLAHEEPPLAESYAGRRRRLVQQLRERTPHRGWHFYDHLEERPANRHHPLYLETPLLDVLRGTTTMEEQRDAIHCTACDVFKLL